MKKAKKEESIDVDELKELWNLLDKNFFIVNKLSHYNDESFFVHSAEVEQLCDISIWLCAILEKLY